MCGRFTHLYQWKQLHRLLRLTTPPVEFKERYNVAPTQDAPVVYDAVEGRRVDFFRWGLVPPWAKDVSFGSRTINARSETVATAPAFRSAFRHRRCIVPVSGFFEWERLGDGKRKQPWYFTPADEDPFAFAGLWEEWSDGTRNKGGGDGPPLRTFTILTTTANAALSPIHDRMPVILPPEQFDAWLDPAVEDAVALLPMLTPCPPNRIRAQRVGTWVSSPAHEDARCIEPVEAAPKGESGLFGEA